MITCVIRKFYIKIFPGTLDKLMRSDIKRERILTKSILFRKLAFQELNILFEMDVLVSLSHNKDIRQMFKR